MSVFTVRMYKSLKTFIPAFSVSLLPMRTREGHIIFLSAQPESEHHELALCPGRDAPLGAKVVQQVSFIVEDLADLKRFYALLKSEGVRIRSVVTHGIALAIYFYDPDDNIVEIYAKTPYKVPQPYSEDIDLNLDDEALMRIAETGGEDGRN